MILVGQTKVLSQDGNQDLSVKGCYKAAVIAQPILFFPGAPDNVVAVIGRRDSRVLPRPCHGLKVFVPQHPTQHF